MREIKFRAWDKSRQKFHNSGNLHIEVSPQGTLCWSFGMAMCEPLFGDERDMWVLQQYTGLKDKNGVEIYEGDIVTDVKGKAVPVLWDEDKARFAVRSDDGFDFNFAKSIRKPEPFIMGLSQFITGHWKIIGNIYENPELLESKQ